MDRKEIMSKKGFILYPDYKEHIACLSLEEQGKLFMAIFTYVESGISPALSGAVGMAFSFIKSQLDRDLEKYIKKCEANTKAGRKGGLAKQANARNAKQTLANLADNDTEKENDIDNDIEYDNELGKWRKKRGV